jgi:hypothetical protein
MDPLFCIPCAGTGEITGVAHLQGITEIESTGLFLESMALCQGSPQRRWQNASWFPSSLPPPRMSSPIASEEFSGSFRA